MLACASGPTGSTAAATDNKIMIRSRLLPLAAVATSLVLTTLPLAQARSAVEEPETPRVASIRPQGNVAREDLPSLAKVSFRQALEAALAAVPGNVIDGELEIEDGNLMYSFEIVSVDKSVTEVEIDAGDGTVLDIDKD